MRRPLYLQSLFLSSGLLAVIGWADAGAVPAGEPAAGPATASLENTLWRLVALGATPVHPQPGLREARFVLAAEKHQVQGDTGCNNHLTGTYTLSEETLKIGPLATTRRACPEETAALQADFLRALEATAAWKIRGETLEILDGVGAVLARFESLYLR